MADVSKDTVMKLWREIGEACVRYMDGALVDLPCKCLQVDEIWSFVYAKQKNVPAEKRGVFGYGDVWTFTAIDAETKLMPSFLVGSRDTGCATEFMQDLARRMASRVQLTKNGHKMYLQAVEDAFGGEIDYAMLNKIYAAAPSSPETRYSPAECIGCEKKVVSGNPEPERVSTSYVERSNLAIRMSLRRFTRLTNAFSKKVANHTAAIGLFHMHYNFCRIHRTLRVTPAMAAGVTSRVWEIADLIALLPTAKGQKRGRTRSGIQTRTPPPRGGKSPPRGGKPSRTSIIDRFYSPSP